MKRLDENGKHGLLSFNCVSYMNIDCKSMTPLVERRQQMQIFYVSIRVENYRQATHGFLCGGIMLFVFF